MKFPISVEEFISKEERLLGEKLSSGARDICVKFLKASNRVYYSALAGEISENPFAGDVREDVSKFNKKYAQAPIGDPFIECLSVLHKWGTEAYEQGIRDREELSA